MARYINNTQSNTESDTPLGVLLINLGSPEAPTKGAVRKYLAEFLWDPRVVETSRPVWWLILHGFILRFRPKHTTAMYKKVWTDEGSPLISISRQQAKKLDIKLQANMQGTVLTDFAMRYGKPSIKGALLRLRAAGAKRLMILPMYPQYSATTTASVFDAVTAELQNWRWIPELRFINNYHNQPGYIEALAKTIINHWSIRDSKPEMLVFSFHGIPKSCIENGDPYYEQCKETARLVAKKLLLKDTKWKLTFQSRVGREEWLQPYTDNTMKQLAHQGIKSLDIVCPGFSADCLETLEEINMENREIFLTKGGEKFDYIPCLNANDFHINALYELIMQHSFGWPNTAPNWDAGILLKKSEKKHGQTTKLNSKQ